MERQNENTSKVEICDVVIEFELDFDYHVKELIEGARLTESKCAINSQLFLQFKRMVVLSSFKKLLTCKVASTLDINPEEKKYY